MENELSPKVLNKSAQIKRNMIKKNKRKLVKTYGKEAERVVIGKAINAAKKAIEMEENNTITFIEEEINWFSEILDARLQQYFADQEFEPF
jgi:hypothetical protein